MFYIEMDSVIRNYQNMVRSCGFYTLKYIDARIWVVGPYLLHIGKQMTWDPIQNRWVFG